MYNSRSEPYVNMDFGLIMMCQSRFINCTKYTICVWDGDNERGHAYVGTKGTWKFLDVPFNFALSLKLVWHKNVLIK